MICAVEKYKMVSLSMREWKETGNTLVLFNAYLAPLPHPQLLLIQKLIGNQLERKLGQIDWEGVEDFLSSSNVRARAITNFFNPTSAFQPGVDNAAVILCAGYRAKQIYANHLEIHATPQESDNQKLSRKQKP